MRESEGLEEAVKDVSAVVHLAAFTNVRYSTKHPEQDFRTNSEGTFNLLEAVRNSDEATRVVFASSNAAVGEVEGAVDETRVPEPLSPYGASKLHGEALCRVYQECYEINTTSLRFANAYGPYAGHKTSVIPKFIRRAKQGKTLEIYGDGKQTRDFIHASDIASAILAALENDSSAGEVYQVASGTETEINSLAEQIQELASEAGKSVEIVHTDPRRGEIKYNYSSIDKIQRDLGWEPRIDLEEGLGELFSSDVTS
jgi:UDP-glucose 4-epimerase